VAAVAALAGSAAAVAVLAGSAAAVAVLAGSPAFDGLGARAKGGGPEASGWTRRRAGRADPDLRLVEADLAAAGPCAAAGTGVGGGAAEGPKSGPSAGSGSPVPTIVRCST
jgi:hypothetical protein